MPVTDIDRILEVTQEATGHLRDGVAGATDMVGSRRNLVQRAKGARRWLDAGIKFAELVAPFLQRKDRRG